MSLTTSAALVVAIQLADHLSKPLDDLVNRLNGVGKRVGEIGQRISTVGKFAFSAGVGLGHAMGVDLKEAGAAAIQAEHALAQIANTAGVQADQAAAKIKQWREQLANLSKTTNQTQDALTGASPGLPAGRGLKRGAFLRL